MITVTSKIFVIKTQVGQEENVIVGIINQEHEAVTYYIEVMIDGIKTNGVGPLALEHEEKREEVVGFTPKKAGEKQKLEFRLYKQGWSDVYHRLHLWVDVR